MTANIKELEQAFEAGRAAQRALSELARADAGTIIYKASPPRSANTAPPVTIAGNGTRKRRAAPPKASVATPKAPKAPAIARGVRKSTGPRTKGVKEAIASWIGNSPSGLTTAEIIAQTGFKETSVRATLMGLKKVGVATQDDEKRWLLAANYESSNSESTTHAAV